MAFTSERIINLLKTHLNYISLLIVSLGLLFKYSVPSLIPFFNRFDIVFFGELFIEFGVLLFLGNILINKYRDEVNEQLFSKILDDKLGTRNSPLLTELENLQSPFSYNLTLYKISSYIKKSKKKPKKYDIHEKRIMRLIPKQDNVYYKFSLGSDEKNDPPIVKSIRINDKKVLNKEFRTVIYPYMGGDKNTYEILTPLKKDREYVIEIECFYPSCMSDLTDEKEYDFHENYYFALTEKTELDYEYDFDNFKDYEFRAEKRHMNVPTVTQIPIEPIEKNKIRIESGNLKNGDMIFVTYTKKKDILQVRR